VLKWIKLFKYLECGAINTMQTKQILDVYAYLGYDVKPPQKLGTDQQWEF